MSTETGFSTESTYFNEREHRITLEIETAKKKLDEAREWFDVQAKLLVQQRDAVLDKTALLRTLREELDERVKITHEAIVSLCDRVTECGVLVVALNELLAPEMQTAKTLGEKINALEQQRDKKAAKPAHEVEALESRLARLKLRRTIAMKRLQKEIDEDAVAAESAEG